MLEYREFPKRPAICFVLFSTVVSYFFYILQKLLTDSLFASPSLDHGLLLGFGVGAGAIATLLIGVVIDRVKRPTIFLYLGSIIPLLFAFVGIILGFPNEFSPLLETQWVLAIFYGMALTFISWIILLNQTVVVKFRGRIVGSFLGLSLTIFAIYSILEAIGVSLYPIGIPIPEIVAIAGIIGSISFRPWKKHLYPLAARGDSLKYFIPMFFILGSHILWYFATQMNILIIFELANDTSYSSLGQHSGLVIFEPLLLAIGAVIAGIVADLKGRKPAFSTAILLVGLLAIFGSTMYGTDRATGAALLNSIPLFIMERTIEGFLLGLCLLLIWTELSLPKNKGKTISRIMFFFLGYMALFWGLEIGAFGLTAPDIIGLVGTQFAVLLSLVALYFIGAAPEVLGREMEMEELELDFDDKMVSDTVDAFVGDDDFESIKSQLDIMDTAQILSDKEFSEIVGDDFKQMLPLRRIPGIGPRMEERLNEAGYTSAAQLAGETPTRLAAKVGGISAKRAERILASARECIQKLFEERKIG